MAHPSPTISVEWIGAERQPVVMIDDLAPDPESLRDAARTAPFERIGDNYPGVRAPVTPAYFEQAGGTLGKVMREFFGIRERVQLLRALYSVSTLPAGELSLVQRVPHADTFDETQIAVVHHLGRDDLGGTAFFRHRATGFETLDVRRAGPYRAALAADFARLGEPPPGYIDADSPIFERIHLSEHRFNRAVVYRGKQLHCAALAGLKLPADPLEGRLTVASFIAAR